MIDVLSKHHRIKKPQQPDPPPHLSFFQMPCLLCSFEFRILLLFIEGDQKSRGRWSFRYFHFRFHILELHQAAALGQSNHVMRLRQRARGDGTCVTFPRFPWVHSWRWANWMVSSFMTSRSFTRPILPQTENTVASILSWNQIRYLKYMVVIHGDLK